MSYVDGFVVPVPTSKLAAYRAMSKKACKVWMELGAIDYRECVGDDLTIKGMTPFTKCFPVKKGETILFSYIVYKSRAHRDRVNAKIMKDPRIAAMCDPSNMPFDMKRMAYGGFKTIVAP